MIILFDIDGTLARCGGAGRAAMSRSFEQVFGVPDAFANVDFRGTVDSWILKDTLRRHGITPTQERISEFHRNYQDALAPGMRPGAYPDQGICPGVEALLDDLASIVPLGLVTGNWLVGARLKLNAFGLWERFPFGAFGEDAEDRPSLVRLALRRAEEIGHVSDGAIMVGDTPLDVAAARKAGIRSVAVCTGWNDRASLEEAGADLVLADLDVGRSAFLAMIGE